MKMKLIIVLILIIIQIFICQINWYGNWGRACDFPKRNYKTLYRYSLVHCNSTCNLEWQCTHFSWRNGNCNLKNGTVYKSNAYFTRNYTEICGIKKR